MSSSDESAKSQLRRRAEAEVSRNFPEPDAPISPDASREALHELRVHQIELEMQNEELRRSQLELEASRARYFDMYDLAPVGYLTINDKGRILEANLTCATLFGVPRSELAGNHLSRFILPEDHDGYYLNRKLLATADARRVFEVRLLRGKTPFWARLEGNALLDADGAPAVRVVVSDISEKRATDDARLQIDSQVQQLRKAESLARMAGAIAHHFNNMLGAVLGNLELAMSDLPTSSATWELLLQATWAGKRATEISGLLLIYLGQGPGTQEMVELSAACGKTILGLQPALPKSLLLQTDLPSSGPVVRLNPNHLRQALRNLITNAWEATSPSQTPVLLTVKTVAATDIPKTYRFPLDWNPSDDTYACIEVADRGVGIAPLDLPNLFDPFFSSKFVGRGLGLSVVLGIARAHHGAVTVRSKLGDGSVFSLFFPLSDRPLPAQASLPAVPSQPSESRVVLLVEDEDIVREVAASMLRRLGFVVLQARDGLEAIEVVRNAVDPVRCVVCDLTMPRMDGWETLVALRRLVPTMAVVLASGYSEGQVMDGAHSDLPDAFLEKPYTMAQLEDAIARALKRPKS